MGNCLKRSQTDDISLLRDNNTSSSTHDLDALAAADHVGHHHHQHHQHMNLPQDLHYHNLAAGSLSLQHHHHHHMTEEDQVRIAKRIGLIQHLPVGYYDGNKQQQQQKLQEEQEKKSSQFNLTITDENVCKKEEKDDDCMTSSTLSSGSRSECVICMNEFLVGERIRYLPCLHIYHDKCIDDWLMRSLTCPSCLEPVDAALLQTYETN